MFEPILAREDELLLVAADPDIGIADARAP